jgi:outer membrane receptor for Fe3+-dicitrate
VGYSSRDIKITRSCTQNIVLDEDDVLLNEMVVVGYATQKRINLTGAVSTVDVGKQLEARPITDIARGLQGSAPGLTVRTATGELGTDPTMKIRGVIGSVNGSSAPLILVDNVECNSLQNINPEDVESVSVL